MASPFPGMDPYLEGSRWTSFHYTFGSELIRQIASRLRPKYLAFPIEYTLLDDDDYVVAKRLNSPDVSTISRQPEHMAGTNAQLVEAPLQIATIILTLRKRPGRGNG